MNLIKPTRLELYCFIFSMPLITVIMNLVMFGDQLWHDYRIWVLSVPLLLATAICSDYVHVLCRHWVEKKYSSLKQSGERIVLKITMLFLVMAPGIPLAFVVYDHIHILGYHLRNIHLLKGFLVGVSVHLIFETLYELDYLLNKYKETVEEKETLEQMSIHHDFNTLKNQVNPHFLFNCFNTLSSLISEDRQKAERLLDELSKVYRYLLRNNEEGVSTLENELKFIQSYYRLLQTRHGQAVEINVQADKRYGPYLLPSLTLQLLVENVVKHNMLSKNKPLVIDIFTTTGNKLVVNNNLQRRSIKAPSNNVGLQNIKAKYDLLKQPGFQVMEDEKNFTVVLPLIWNNTGRKQTPGVENKKLY